MAVIKPIETIYNGYRFRSRLEARWAVFFDAIGADWEYEPEGFDLGNDMYYLPDFLIHNGKGRAPSKLWIEVKSPHNFSTEDQAKVQAFARPAYMGHEDSNTRAILVVGNIPNLRTLPLICDMEWDCEKGIFSLQYVDGDCSIAIPAKSKSGGFHLSYEDDYYADDVDEQGTIYAYDLARQARFEHGETPRSYNINDLIF